MARAAESPQAGLCPLELRYSETRARALGLSRRWELTNELSFFSAEKVGHRILLTGQCGDNLGSLIFDTTQGLFERGGNEKGLRAPPKWHASFLYNDKVYVYDGTERQGESGGIGVHTRKLSCWDIVLDEWSEVSTYIYHDTDKFADDGHGNRESRDTGNQLHPLPPRTPREFPPAVYWMTGEFVSNFDEFILFGGNFKNIRSKSNHVYMLSLRSEKLLWHKPKIGGQPPDPRSGHSSCMAGGKMLVYGGRGEEVQFFADLHVLHFHPLSSSGPHHWSEITPRGLGNIGSLSYASMTVYDGAVLIFGGMGMTFGMRNTLLALTLSKNEGVVEEIHKVEVKGNLPATYGHCALQSSNGILILGGSGRTILQIGCLSKNTLDDESTVGLEDDFSDESGLF